MNRVLDVYPVKTEKSFKLAQQGTYTFAVLSLALKNEIIQSIKQLYGVDVIEMRSLVRKGKKKMNWKIRKPFMTKQYKKVYVTLAKGQSLDIYN